MEQISREADVPNCMINDDDLPGGSGDPDHAYINMRVHNKRTLAGAPGGDGSLVDQIDTRNVPDTE